MAINAISSALSAIQRQTASMDRAAEKIQRSASSSISDAPASAQDAEALASQEGGLVDGTVEMLVSTQMLTAALRLAQTANEGLAETLRLGGYGAHDA